jgi:hypothetical protein
MEIFPMYESPYPDLDRMIFEKCGRRLVQSGDPEPIDIKCNTSGPLNVAKGYIMCDCCGSIIRSNYLKNHRKSGACIRSVEKQERKTQDSHVSL